MTRRTRTIWRREKLPVEAAVTAAGDMVITGQDLSGTLWAEYEYALTLRRDDIDTLVTALGGRSGDDVLDLLRSHAESLVTAGERS